MADARNQSFGFLFRTDEGLVDRAVWWRGSLPLAALALAMTGIWTLLRPYTAHDLATTPFLNLPTIAAFLYLAIFAFGLILIAVCEYNLSAKRFRDRGRPASLAAALPLISFCAAALIWFIPQSFGTVPDWAGPVAIVAVLIVLAWNIWDLGFGPSVGAR